MKKAQKITIELLEGKSYMCDMVSTFTNLESAVKFINTVDPLKDNWFKFRYTVDFGGDNQYTGMLTTGEVTLTFDFVAHIEKALKYFRDVEQSREAEIFLAEVFE